ncbi:MAG: RdgB/HAM1 family non-canonical purine NTP pyrophosphatase [Methanoregula sp.]|nr:RdgB/HAM1 family non-canonical purine NTP pyrophosphatase [Methanoregula sp.]
MKLTLVTTNAHKAEEVAAFFGGMLEVEHIAMEIPEHRSDDVRTIARGKARFAFEHLKTPVIVDDTGLSIDALNGFPGPYAAYVLHTIGNEGILKLMERAEDRRAHFTTAIAFADGDGERVFQGTLHGRIALSPRGRGGFGYDPIFEWEGRTLAELRLEEKSRISHRAKALRYLREWFVKEHRREDARDTNG